VILDIVLSDTVVDLMDARTDVAIRVGPMRASQLMARKLGESPMAVVASPDYLARHGAPATPRDLAAHNCIGFNFARHCDKWPFVDGGERLSLPIHGDATAATARPRASWPWSARAWPGWPISTSAATSPPAGWSRCWRPTIPATSRRSTRSMSATAASCPAGCGR
jgi:DNA-binding transcriptional LysR family regulator